MRRLTAGLLLLFAGAGTFLPVALQAMAAPPHACCRRKAAHQCHESVGSNSEESSVRSSGCCNHNCCRTATTSRWANAHAIATHAASRNVDGSILNPPVTALARQTSRSHSTRAPPQAAIA